MGRYSTGAVTTDGALRIELSYLLKNNFIKKGCIISSTLSWTNGSSISMESRYFGDEIWLQLKYTLTDFDGKIYKYDYKVYLVERPSNLRVGNVLYFVCPNSGNLCRILYRCYHSHIWKARTAYQNRIYYPSQTSSKLNYFNDRYWQITRTLEKLQGKRKYCFYKSEKTRKQKRIEKMQQQQFRFDELRWTVGVPKRLKGYLGNSFY